ncbi:MAG: hypothetical protein A3I11_09020 [Elusimicrobia bacterium RIFCSPLOWO2_02_FULL_39_32]|nr:MAG: hypothetical protein A2034_00535 [Elusimicrobia bacterium GWA2_38_7]OGR80469.1 MAG: hypothetical protein A3B80_04585 [Elusimicrobia bacterium RIFCSPHIGHO2_02_FULL_39_36]OGR93399.1 MAG: hypothetical protein A3I11_09020 [Elusimicrobia bacterium RIFCSPLOWO2_02_FULL_39_32]OGS00599.1 MAG: hypothetical protein A3G85_00135 [Elusimicrobia bacterium RIFCSPLOWO2_12_FULL_39_28]
MKKKILKSQRQNLKGRVILLGLTGSIAIYKSCELLRQLKEEGAEVYCLMSFGAQKFISPLTFSALSGNPVALEVWDPNLWKMAHLELADKADLYIIAPASTNCLAKLSCGLCDDIITATASATRAPILLAPAMHEGMWKNPSTQVNVKKLKAFGYTFVGPEYGELLRGTKGWGRLAEPSEIVQAALKLILKS